MKQINLYFFIFAVGTAFFYAGPAYAQKGKTVVRAVERMAQETAVSTAKYVGKQAASVQAVATVTLSMREKAAESANQAVSLKTLAALEENLRLNVSRSNVRLREELQFLLATQVKDDVLKETLLDLLKKKEFKNALDLVTQLWAEVVPVQDMMPVAEVPAVVEGAPVVKKVALASKSIPGDLNFHYSMDKLDLTRGVDLGKAVRLLINAKEEGLLAVGAYRALLWTLYHNKPKLFRQILSGDLSKEFWPVVKADDEGSYLAALVQRTKFEVLEPKKFNPSGPFSERAMRQSIKYSQLRACSSAELKKYYEKQPIWIQEELDRKAASLEAILIEKYDQQRLGRSKDFMSRRRKFVLSVVPFFEGKVQNSPGMMEFLSTPYAPADLKLQVKSYMSNVPQSAVERKKMNDLLRQFYDTVENNHQAKRTFDNQTEMANLEVFSTLAVFVRQNGWPSKESSAWVDVVQLSKSKDPLVQEMLRRLEANGGQNPLAEEALTNIKNYVAKHGSLPPTTTPLYHQVRHFKDYPTKYRAEFLEIFETYQRHAFHR